MEKEFDLLALLKACNYNHCDIYLDNGDEYSQLATGDLHDKLIRPDAESVAFIKDNYEVVKWEFRDTVIPVFEVQYTVADDSVHFYYPGFDVKTKNTLVNILKSQNQWKYVGYGLFDNDVDDIIVYGWFDEEEIKNDVWLHTFDKDCNDYIEDSHHASLYKYEETDEDGNVVDGLSITISINPDVAMEKWARDVPVSLMREELAKYEEEYAELKVMIMDNDEGEPYYLSTVEVDDDDGGDGDVDIHTTYDEHEALDVVSLMELLRQIDDEARTFIFSPNDDLLKLALREPFFSKTFGYVFEEVIACFTPMEEEEEE